ncbi:hypothetical protein DAPPUDRAFT_253187 [Daphnia pulex]|uniref:Uncharacterized protein n=1 Tax=Daphnia pulex TaxID=6669 RepID=E9H4A9_DAPPU|nr:hypothetical protein DAPPUDRAFT_253187 [Daphnia pulex]|eukprot:EFX73350.1 hypothetical protein DAPPUDRAFT_253187 [Daphnia pulex]
MDGTKRFCIDFLNLNTETIKEEYPIPIVEETKDYLSLRNLICLVINQEVEEHFNK